jgi:metacaspase-1
MTMAKKPIKQASSAKKMSLDELTAMMRDPTVPVDRFRDYLILDESAGGSFSPAVIIDRSKVEIGGTMADSERGDLGLPFMNGITRLRRRAAFNLKLALGYDGPILVAEGDSWFLYPLLLEDVIDQLSDDYAISSLAAAGDTMDDMLAQDEFIREIRLQKASVLLYSAGGNDVLGNGNLAKLLRNYDPALAPAQHILPSFGEALNRVIGHYDRIFRRVARETPGVAVICHGYGRPIPNNGKWLGKPMAERGLPQPVQTAIATVMIDRFNTAMIRLVARHAHVSFVDCRPLVLPDQWSDELHPDNDGYKAAADAFKAAITAALRPWRAGPARKIVSGADAAKAAPARKLPPVMASPPVHAVTGAKGHSLHLGLNRIDPVFYGSDFPLLGCHNDAHAMHDLAGMRGFAKRTVLLDDKATRGALIDHVLDAAKVLKAGDMFLLTYAGHGNVCPDIDGDEDDDEDSTWCLYDGEFIDDEFLQLWTQFAEGVRIFMISDSCHSGTVLRAGPGDAPPTMLWRQLPPAGRAHVETHRRPREPLRRSDGSAVIAEPSVLCMVRLFAACSDNQKAGDGEGPSANGVFTAALLESLGGMRGRTTYRGLFSSIMRRMPPIQTPEHTRFGNWDGSYDAQRPFEI